MVVHMSTYKNDKPLLNNDNSDLPAKFLPTLSLSELITMPRPALEALTRRLLCQCGEAATMTEEETAQAALDILAETFLKPITMGMNVKADINSRMAAIDKWLDRKKGKPIQSLDMNVKDTRVDKMEIDKLIKLAAMLDDPIIIAPLPTKE